jgi:ComF family protein
MTWESFTVSNLNGEGAFSDIDYLLPVPLHSRKLKKRGYNQSEWIARGLAEGLGKQVDTRVLTRKIHTTTQTRKSKEERWTNVAEAFQVGKSNVGGSSHFLLVDDVLTTGATLEACGTALLEELPNLSIKYGHPGICRLLNQSGSDNKTKSEGNFQGKAGASAFDYI